MKHVSFKLDKAPKRYRDTVEFKTKAMIAELRLKGNSAEEIVGILADKGITGPKGGKITTTIIHNCVKDAEVEWRENFYEAVDEHQKRLVRELQQVRKEAWSNGALSLVVKTIVEEAKMLGVGLNNDKEKQPTGQKLIGSDEQQLIGNLLREAIERAARDGVKLPSTDFTDADFRDITGEESGNMDSASEAVTSNTE